MTTTEMGVVSTKTGTNESTPAFLIQDLTVLDSPIRAKFISLICTATYDDLDEEGAATFIEKCLKLCGGSKDLLSQVLQTPFMDNRTPLFSVLCHTQPVAESDTTIPPLITHLFDYLELSKRTIDDMELACCVTEHKRLYQLIRQRHLQCGDIVTIGSWHDPDHWECCIRIPRFIDKMLTSQKVVTSFIIWWTLFDLTFSVTPQDEWTVRLEIKAFYPWAQLKRPSLFGLGFHKLRLYHPDHDKWVTDCKELGRSIKDREFPTDGLRIDFLRGWDDYLDKRRTLVVSLALTDWDYYSPGPHNE